MTYYADVEPERITELLRFKSSKDYDFFKERCYVKPEVIEFFFEMNSIILRSVLDYPLDTLKY